MLGYLVYIGDRNVTDLNYRGVAIKQPADVDVNEMIIRPTKQEL